jgi:hypothetical protein
VGAAAGLGSGVAAPGRDGNRDGSVGGNGDGGRWSAGPGGSFVAVSGVQTLIGYAGQVDAGAMFTRAAPAGSDGEVLVLADRAGEESGRPRRASV